MFTAATSISERVASERAEKLGTSVGYQIRLEKIAPRSYGSVMFCTTGVLLKFLELDPGLNDYSHIIIDEIHERDVHIDVCLALIKQIVQRRKNLKVILMSATLNAETFSRYFSNCPSVHIEGFTFKVKELFLEDIIEETDYRDFKEPRSKREPVWVKYRDKNKIKDQVDEFEMIVGNYANSLRGQYSPETIKTIQNPETENVDVNFIEFLIHHISYNKQAGAILVILPGFAVISKLFENLQRSPKFPNDKFVIYPLHSLLTGNDQRNIFIRPSVGVRKIILSTPLAETSITIDDVVFVINSGKMRKPFFDFDKSATVFEDEWVTTANETQRKGRAGRVQAGFCYHLYTRGRSNSLEPFEKPEILRIRLEELVLTIKVVSIKQIKWFISTFMDVPEEDVVDKSITMLQRLGALDEKEDLTPLGLHLARLAVHPQIGKMLLLSSVFSCFDPISSIAAGLSFKSPFYTVMGKEEMCNKAKRQFSNDSDQLAVSNAVKAWKDGGNSQRGFCYENFLSPSTLMMLDRMKTQFGLSLHQSKFLPKSACNGEENNKNSRDENLLRAVICGGLYPNIAHRRMRVSRYKRSEIIRTAEKRVKLVLSSVNSDDTCAYESGFLVYHEQQKLKSGLFLTETTANIGPFAILMFGDRLNKNESEGTQFLSAGDIVNFKCNQETADMIIQLRNGFNRLLEKKIESPSPIIWDSSEGKLLKSIIELISIGGKQYAGDYEDDDDED